MRKGGLVYAPYPFGEARILKQRIGVSLFNSSMRIWESLSESETNPSMTAQEWQRRSGGVHAKTVLALAEALADAQARFGESEFLSVERDGEKIRFRSKAIEDAFKAREKTREKVGEFRERKRKNSESFSESFESFSKSFETASPRSEHLSGNPPPCNGYLNNKEENKKKKDDELSLSTLPLSASGDSDGGKRERGRLSDFSDEEIQKAWKLYDAYPQAKRIPRDELLRLLKLEGLFGEVDRICTLLPEIKRESWEGKEHFTPGLDKFLTDDKWTQRWRVKTPNDGAPSGESEADELRRLGYRVL